MYRFLFSNGFRKAKRYLSHSSCSVWCADDTVRNCGILVRIPILYKSIHYKCIWVMCRLQPFLFREDNWTLLEVELSILQVTVSGPALIFLRGLTDAFADLLSKSLSCACIPSVYTCHWYLEYRLHFCGGTDRKTVVPGKKCCSSVRFDDWSSWDAISWFHIWGKNFSLFVFWWITGCQPYFATY